MNYGLISFIVLIASFLFMLYSYEKNHVSIKEISLIAVMSALAGLGRVPFAGIPNVQPTTFMVIVSGYVFGPAFGFMTGAIATLVSNSFLGQGPWTPWQMLSWGLAGFSAGIMAKFLRNPSRNMISIFAFAWGFIFDYIMNLWHWLTFIYPHSFSSFIAVYAASIYFDLAHAIGNYAFAYIFGKDFISILSRFKARISYERLERQ